MVEQTIPIGVSYYRAKYYDANPGRFLSVDHHAISMLGEWPGLSIQSKFGPLQGRDK